MKASESNLKSENASLFPDECYCILLKYLDLGDIMKKMIGLNKNVRT